jgi:spore germination protein KC
VRKAVVAALLVGLLMTTGCGDLVDLDRKAIVVGVALDPGKSPGTVQVAIQYLAPTSGGGGGGSTMGAGSAAGTNANPVTLTATGANVDDAIRLLRDETSRFFYLGNLGIILIGEDLARQGIMAPLDYFLRDGEIAETTEIAVTQGPAVSVLRASNAETQEGTALPLFQLLTQAERVYFPVSPNVMWRVFSQMEGSARASFAPLVAPSQQGPAFDIAGLALLRQGRLAGMLTGYPADVADWLLKRAGYPDATVTLSGERTPSALRINRRSLKTTVLGSEEVGLALSFDTTVRESSGFVMDDRDVAPLEQAAAAQMQSQIRGVLNAMQADGTDVLGLADQVLARYPSLASEAWPTLFQRMRIDLSVAVHIYEGGRQT